MRWFFLVIILLFSCNSFAQKKVEFGAGGTLGEPLRLGIKGVVQSKISPWGGQLFLGSYSGNSIIRAESRYLLKNADLRWFPYLGFTLQSDSILQISGGGGIEARTVPGGGFGLDIGLLYKISGSEQVSSIGIALSLSLLIWLH